MAHGLDTVLDAEETLCDRRDVLSWLVGEGARSAELQAEERRRGLENVRPSTMFEAMAAACPVILGVRDESRARLDDSGGGIGIEPGSGAALALQDLIDTSRR